MIPLILIICLFIIVSQAFSKRIECPDGYSIAKDDDIGDYCQKNDGGVVDLTCPTTCVENPQKMGGKVFGCVKEDNKEKLCIIPTEKYNTDSQVNTDSQEIVPEITSTHENSLGNDSNQADKKREGTDQEDNQTFFIASIVISCIIIFGVGVAVLFHYTGSRDELGSSLYTRFRGLLRSPGNDMDQDYLHITDHPSSQRQRGYWADDIYHPSLLRQRVIKRRRFPHYA